MLVWTPSPTALRSPLSPKGELIVSHIFCWTPRVRAFSPKGAA
jgi:hypothetical protein